MMTETFKNTETPIISVIGIGNDSKKYIDEINDWASPLVSAKMLDRDFTGPETGLAVSILIITENVDATILAKNLKQSGILTLIVATREIRAMEGSYESMAIVSENKVMETVQTISEILTNPPQFPNIDIYGEIHYIFKDSGTLHAFSLKSYWKKGESDSFITPLREKLKVLPPLKKLLVIFKFSRANFFGVKEIKDLVDFFSTLQIPVLWGLDANESLAGDELAIMAIATESRKSKE